MEKYSNLGEEEKVILKMQFFNAWTAIEKKVKGKLG